MPALAKALAFTPEPDDPDRAADQQVLDYLHSRRILLLLDNFEQLLGGQQGESSTAGLHQLLENAPQATLLITSRERLHLRTEHVLPLDGLPCPASHEREIDDYAAVQLFQQSARRLQPKLADQTSALKGGRQKVALSAIEADVDNIRKAWAWAVGHQEWALLFDAAFSLGTFFYRQGRHQEGLTLFSNAVVRADTDSAASPQIRARLLYWQAVFKPVATTRQSWLNTALALLETAVPSPTPISDAALAWSVKGLQATAVNANKTRIHV